MAVKLLPLRTIITPACWPYSGYRYEVWQGTRCILRTDDYAAAQAKAEAT